MTKFIDSRPYFDPAAAARNLIEIVQELVWPQGYAYTGVNNMTFLRSGGSVAEYGAGVAYGTTQGLFAIDESSPADTKQRAEDHPTRRFSAEVFPVFSISS